METKEFLTILVRYFLFAFGTWLVGRNLVPQYIADAITNFALAPLVGLIVVGGTLLWRWAKARFDRAEKTLLYETNPEDASRKDIKLQVREDNKLTLPL